ncbi:MAG TPA: AAA family ATPase [Cyanobacteria bacterium UBA11372]|nr:AAA family ATPase [Cyanobacteria bacterium UBA11372]
MRANPGGQVAPDEVIGRQGLIQNLWYILESQSLILSAERRMGKTCVIKKMQAEAPKDKLPIYHDLEKVRSPLEFVETILQDVEEYLGGLKRTARKTRQLLTQLSGAEFSGFKLPEIAAPHWKNLLIQTIADLVENQDRTVILFWDEVPYMLSNIGDEAAMEVLDTLRSLRQMYPGVRMVFTGSIGLHHVIGSLKEKGYANAPINDMYIEDVPPLSTTDATDLTCRLLRGENISTPDLDVTAAAIVDNVNGIPFYIHHIIRQLKQSGKSSSTTVTDIVNSALTDPLSRWDMGHYRDRIDTYYDDQKRPYALNLLDILAVTNQPLLLNDLLDRLKSGSLVTDREMVLNVLRLLQRDYYVIQETNSQYRFRYSLIQRYWQVSRGLV